MIGLLQGFSSNVPTSIFAFRKGVPQDAVHCFSLYTLREVCFDQSFISQAFSTLVFGDHLKLVTDSFDQVADL